MVGRCGGDCGEGARGRGVGFTGVGGGRCSFLTGRLSSAQF